MQVREPIQPSHPLVHLRVVLHGARPERIKLRVDAEVPLAQPHEVTNRFGLADLGQRRGRSARETRQGITRVYVRHVERAERNTAPALRAAFENRELLELEPLCCIAWHGITEQTACRRHLSWCRRLCRPSPSRPR